MNPEFSVIVRVHDIGTLQRSYRLAASADARVALAARFGLLALDRLDAELTIHGAGACIVVTGRVRAAGEQCCSVSAEPVAFTLDEPVDLRFAALALPAADAEIELDETDLEILPLDGDAIDLGEVMAQGLGLGLDPYPRAPAAVRAAAERFIIDEAAARAASSPFAVLKRP